MASPLLDIHMIDDERCSTTTSSLSILSPPLLILKDCLDKLVQQDHSFANYCPTLAHTSDVGQGLLAQGQLGNLKDSMEVVGPSEQVTGDVEVADERPGFTMAPSSPSMVPESTSTTPSEISPMAQLLQDYSSAEISARYWLNFSISLS